MFCIELAELSVGIVTPYTELRDYCRDFLTDAPPVFTVTVSDEEISKEGEDTRNKLPAWYYASVVAYRKIAERLPLYDAAVCHGCAVTLKEQAYLFLAKSGVGKTTHARNWLLAFAAEGADILNGDKPILRLVNGEIRVYGTPWRGKEGYGKNGFARLSGIAFLERAAENRAAPLSCERAALALLSFLYLPKENAQMRERVLTLADAVLSQSRLLSLFVNMEKESAFVARRVFEGYCL